MRRYLLFLIVTTLGIISCNNGSRNENGTSQIPDIEMDTSAPEISLPDTSHTNQTYIEPDTSQKIYCDFIEGRWNVVGTSNEDERSFKESVTFECKNSKVITKTPSLVSHLA